MSLVNRRVVIRDLEFGAKIGIYTHERMDAQMIRINISLDVGTEQITDRIEDVVSYETVCERVKAECAKGHVNLAETLAERIADLCLAFEGVHEAWVRLEKLHAIAEAAGVGCEVTKRRDSAGSSSRKA
jgi:dihydroneopterin aldolase